MVWPRSGRCGDDDISSCSDVVGADVDGDLVGDAVGRSEGANVGRLVALTGALVGEPGVTVGLVVIGCSVGFKVGRALVFVLVVGAGGSVPMSDFSSLLSRMVKTHTKATMRPTRSKKMKPNAAVLGLLILRRRSFLLALPPSDPGAGAACDGEHVLLSFIVICKAYSYESSTTMLILAKGQLQQLPPIQRQGAQASKEQSFKRMRLRVILAPPHRLTRLAFGEIQQIQASTPSLLKSRRS